MIFGGFQPFSLSDFPGHTSAIVFTQGCNFRCPFCHNGRLISPCRNIKEETINENFVLDFLCARQGRLDGLVVSGGEPTLQSGLPVFLRRVKALGYRIKLDTNGTRPNMLKALFSMNLLDYVAMDVKAPLKRYALLAGVPVLTAAIVESIALIADSGIKHEFRTTYVESLLRPTDIKAIQRLLPPSSPHRIQEFKPELAQDPALRPSAKTAVAMSSV